MAGFNELVKNHERIRHYIRDFLIYGYKSRNDYAYNSSRSYDNERRRIESYLGDYIRTEHSTRGKRMFISSDTQNMEQNPLSKTWMTKSFTRNDIMLHFMILDTLSSESNLSANAISDVIYERYLSRVDITKPPDTMTIRNKLKEYTMKGYLTSTKKGRSLVYALGTSPIKSLTKTLVKKLYMACGYYQNVIPVGIIGTFIQQKIQDVKDLATFSFRHFYIAHTLDDNILLQLLFALKRHTWVDIHIYNRRQDTVLQLKILPLKIIQNVSLGRRYVSAYSYYTKRYSNYRLDYIRKVTRGHLVKAFQAYQDTLATLRKDTWGINIYHQKDLESVKMTLHIDEAHEQYLIDRIHREGRHGELNKMTNNTFCYEILVIDANEMIPWLRTFIGRIIAFECSNGVIERKFIDDIRKMIDMYGGE
ncbi:WYL domain-containing protein [Vallitalea pronyensis]|uniref:WYL domain-containing protein n=1 Tax=Vallitalea pronyensis TaxID=1348613 RepID=A0A8J8MJV0_9FIRM|nr:WYL domain-containing protein [Vallitalea pronyensis]QUI22771.1 WYL domain-containing protein [Vallitalea pronyensis]